MSGKRQHFIPRFLIAGFTDHCESNSQNTHVFRVGGKHFIANIKNIGLEGYFYGEPGQYSLDDRITKIEEEVSRILVELRSFQHGQVVDSERCSFLCSHLATRTRHLRIVFTGFIQSFIKKVADYYRDPAKKERIVRMLFENGAPGIREALTKALAADPRAKHMSAQDKEKLVALMVNNPDAVVEALAESLTRDMAGMLETIRKQALPIVGEAHNKGLNKDNALAEHEKKLSNYKWRVLKLEEDLILGDFLLLGRVEAKPYMLSYIMTEQLPSEMYLPISHNKLLLGSGTGELSSAIDVKSLNQEIASNSLEYFVAASDCPEYRELSKQIGKTLEMEREYYDHLSDEVIRTKLLGGMTQE